jgi:hypothetical protein
MVGLGWRRVTGAAKGMADPTAQTIEEFNALLRRASEALSAAADFIVESIASAPIRDEVGVCIVAVAVHGGLLGRSIATLAPEPNHSITVPQLGRLLLEDLATASWLAKGPGDVEQRVAHWKLQGRLRLERKEAALGLTRPEIAAEWEKLKKTDLGDAPSYAKKTGSLKERFALTAIGYRPYDLLAYAAHPNWQSIALTAAASRSKDGSWHYRYEGVPFNNHWDAVRWTIQGLLELGDLVATTVTDSTASSQWSALAVPIRETLTNLHQAAIPLLRELHPDIPHDLWGAP